MIMKGGKNIFTLAVLTGCKKKFAVPVRVVERSQLQQGFVNGMERASKGDETSEIVASGKRYSCSGTVMHKGEASSTIAYV